MGNMGNEVARQMSHPMPHHLTPLAVLMHIFALGPWPVVITELYLGKRVLVI